MLSADEVALATLRLIGSDLTGQVFDIKRHDAAGVAPAVTEPVGSGSG
jgi:hypothetical protein